MAMPTAVANKAVEMTVRADRLDFAVSERVLFIRRLHRNFEASRHDRPLTTSSIDSTPSARRAYECPKTPAMIFTTPSSDADQHADPDWREYQSTPTDELRCTAAADWEAATWVGTGVGRYRDSNYATTGPNTDVFPLANANYSSSTLSFAFAIICC